ncbi:hypothetical protein ILUMI_14398, partial [Ignelater luminosus]
MINDAEIVEVKSTFKVASSGHSLNDAVKSGEVPCLQMIADVIKLKKTHDYLYQ